MKFLPLVLKIWPIAAAVCGAIWFVSQGDYGHALAVLGLGTAASASGQVLHQTETPK